MKKILLGNLVVVLVICLFSIVAFSASVEDEKSLIKTETNIDEMQKIESPYITNKAPSTKIEPLSEIPSSPFLPSNWDCDPFYAKYPLTETSIEILNRGQTPPDTHPGGPEPEPVPLYPQIDEGYKCIIQEYELEEWAERSGFTRHYPCHYVSGNEYRRTFGITEDGLVTLCMYDYGISLPSSEIYCPRGFDISTSWSNGFQCTPREHIFRAFTGHCREGFQFFNEFGDYMCVKPRE